MLNAIRKMNIKIKKHYIHRIKNGKIVYKEIFQVVIKGD